MWGGDAQRRAGAMKSRADTCNSTGKSFLLRIQSHGEYLRDDHYRRFYKPVFHSRYNLKKLKSDAKELKIQNFHTTPGDGA